jgi:anaerobic selenocysteine-containing dehydrogenase
MRSILYLISTFLFVAGAAAEECKYQKTYEGAYKVFEAKDNALVFKAKFYVNTDGSVKSYHKVDIRGRTMAINNVCNGVNVVGLDGTRHPGGNNASCPALRQNFELARDAGWTSSQAPKVEFFAIATKSCEPSGKCIPCETPDGFLVSTTGLSDATVQDRCDPAKYFDSLKLPAIVIPKRGLFIDKGVKQGDLVVVRNRTTGETLGALVGDTGPANNLGEGTVYLAMKLRGRAEAPTNYQDAVRLSLNLVDYAVFPGTSGEITGKDRFDAAKIQLAAMKHFNAWGGSSQLSKCVQ